MGINIELEGSPEGPNATDLCTNGGYEALCEWIETLDAAEFSAVRQFADKGMYAPTDELCGQLERALVEHRPDDPDTFHVADRLADLMGGGYPDETVRIES